MRTKQDSDWLKTIAVLSMIIDHIGAILFPKILLLRIIGRIAFPIFAYQIAVGIKKTSNLRKYQKGLLLFAFLSQIPYFLALRELSLDVLFTFSIAVLFLTTRHTLVKIAMLVIVFFIPMDYGWYGVSMVVIFYYFIEKKTLLLVNLLLLTILDLALNRDFVQAFSVIPIFLTLYVPMPSWKNRMPKSLFYWFYPIQFIILWLITLFV